ncbi:MAG: type II toxin-antitoxin system RelE/ParE family toxin [Halieaceae bacterium]|nr:type II toxin-antitoxin system RelE/ParE family toxin [Halieaceae bacterium]
MPRILKQAQAELDLIDIWLHSSREWGDEQADQYLDDLDQAIQLLAEQPLMCRERPEFFPPVRIHHHAHHLIVYSAVTGGISVVRVLHESMNVDAHLD